MKHATLLFALLIAALCLSRTSAQAPPSPPLTGKIAHITILGTKNIPVNTVRAVLTHKPGDPYTPDAAAKDVTVIKGMGVFHTVTVGATPAPSSSVDLTYTVEENPIVQSIKFTTNATDGKPSVPFSELFSQMKTRVGQVLNTNIIVKDIDSLFNHTDGYAVKQGHLFDVSSNINIDPKTGVLTIPLVEYHIQTIEVTGNSRIRTIDLLAQIHTRVGDIFSKNSIDEDVARLYETADFRAVNYNISGIKQGEVALKLSVMEQAAATGELDEKQGKVIPFLYDPPNIQYPLVQVSINGKPPLSFILDTGTSAALALDPWAAKELGLKVDGKAETENGVSFTRVPINGVVLQGRDQSDNAVFDIKEVFVADLGLLSRITPSPGLAGIVGLGLLKTATSRINFAAKTLTIWTAPHPPLDIPNGTVLPLRGTPDGHFTVRATLAPETYAELNVDTGSNDTQIPLSTISVLHPTVITPIHYEQRVDETIISPVVRLASLTIGKLRVSNVEAGTLPPSSRLSLGLDILADYRLTLDAPNGQLIMEPMTVGERYPHGQSGLSATAIGNAWVVSAFTEKSPAQAAGLKVGDQFVSVSGVKVQGLPISALGKLVTVRLGTPLSVLIRRSGKDIPISWIPVDNLNAPPSAIDGLPMQKPLGGPWTILEVVQGCSGDKAGLQADDTLTKINGATTANMSLDHFAELAKKPVVVLEIERVGLAKPFTVRLSVPK